MNSGVVDVSQYSSWKEILLLEEVNRESLANMRKEIQRMLATTKQQKTVSMTIKDGLVLLVELHDVLSANLKKKGPLMEILKTEVEQSTRWSPEKEGKDLIRKRLHSEAPDSRASRESEGELTDITAFPGATFRDTIPGCSRVEESKLGKEDKLINKSEEEEMETDSEGSSQTVTDSDSLNAPHKLRFRKDKKDLSKEAQRKAAREAEREADRLKRIQKQAEAEKRKKEAERNKREEEAKQRTERDKRRKQADTINRKKRRKRPQALVIKVSETLPYAEVLRKLKLSVKPADTNTEIRAIRKTMGGDVMLEMEPSCGITESFRKSVEDAVGGGLVKDLKPRASLEIRDIDSLTPADEVRAGIERKLGGPREDLTVNLTAPNGRQQILAIVSLAGGDAEKLVKNRTLIIISIKEEINKNEKTVLLGGAFVIMALPISIWKIIQHMIYYSRPSLQKCIIRILWMVPIYALNGWLGLVYPDKGIYVDSGRECYEAYVIYNFLKYLLNYLNEEMDLEINLALKPQVKHSFPLCWIPNWKMGRELVSKCKHGILQYTLIRPVTTFISFICALKGVYGEGEFKPDKAYPYIVAINNVSQFMAMYCLYLFYRANKEELRSMKPIGKFLCIKAVVFFSFFQGVLIKLAAYYGFLNFLDESPNPTEETINALSNKIQNFLICIEMFLAAIAHHYCFSHDPYINDLVEKRTVCDAFVAMWDVSDIQADLKDHIGAIGSSLKPSGFKCEEMSELRREIKGGRTFTILHLIMTHPSSARLSDKFMGLIFTILVLTGRLLILVEAMQQEIDLPEPDCYIEYEMMVDRCTYSQGDFSNDYIIRPFNGSEGVWNKDVNYVNISVNYPTGFQGILQVAVVKQLRFSHVLLQLDLTNLPFRPHHPFTLKLIYLPYNLKELRVRQLGSPGRSYITEDPCNRPETIYDCNILTSNFKLAMKSKKNSIELKLNRPFTHPLKVELYGRLCHTSCDDLYPSCSTNLTSFQWLNPLVDFSVNNLKSAYYCARVIYNTHNQDCCSIFTKTSSVHFVQFLPHSAHNFHLSTFFYVMLIMLFLIVLVIIFIYLQYCGGMVRHLSKKAQELQTKDNTPLIHIQKATQEIEVLLMYPKKDKLFMNMMSSFRKLLKIYAKNGVVWDPLDPEQLENVVENPGRWMQRVLMNPDLKIVFVETEEAVAWFDDENRTLVVGDEDLYINALSYIHNHPELIFNYQRLLVVRFDYIKPHTLSTLTMVPQKRYNMPHQLGLLIMDIIDSQEYALDHEGRPDDTAEQFYKLTEEYQQRSNTVLNHITFNNKSLEK
ncbi:hypothetical protein GE061_000447 [Apolygus lucorum]|uniref:Uncharacterized protein n=1 Tax=Apolygus lucorum TaxID=248454 RepID=A0A8S9Y5V4_APOLU|nr:hypothetical protein GE061_000447 [Apolygus lucorum]